MMIESYIKRLPSATVDLNDFPYLEDFLNYIFDELNNLTSDKLQAVPKLFVRDTPFLESHCIDLEGDSAVIFDIGTSLFCLELNKTLKTGRIERSLWNILLKFAANINVHAGKPNAALAHALWLIANPYDSSSVLELDDEFSGAHAEKTASIKTQEMFILAHEMAHAFSSNDVFDLDSVRDVIQNDIEDGLATIFDDQFIKHLGLLGNPDKINQPVETILYDEFLSDKAFCEEVICDMFACDIAFEYFTWDAGTFSHDDVAASIQFSFMALALLANIRFRIESDECSLQALRRNEAGLFFRIRIMNQLIEKKVINERFIKLGGDARHPVYEVIDFLVVHQDRSRRRFLAILKLLDQLFSDLELLESIGEAHAHLFVDPQAAAVYYSGYNNETTDSDEFFSTDGTLFIRNKDLKAKVLRSFEKLSFEVSQQNLKVVRDIMNAMHI